MVMLDRALIEGGMVLLNYYILFIDKTCLLRNGVPFSFLVQSFGLCIRIVPIDHFIFFRSGLIVVFLPKVVLVVTVVLWHLG